MIIICIPFKVVAKLFEGLVERNPMTVSFCVDDNAILIEEYCLYYSYNLFSCISQTVVCSL